MVWKSQEIRKSQEKLKKMTKFRKKWGVLKKSQEFYKIKKKDQICQFKFTNFPKPSNGKN